tara:strand:+ start:2867 stop:3442 length:576 start_codon:yes stop_codon:yes gene_type:complete
METVSRLRELLQDLRTVAESRKQVEKVIKKSCPELLSKIGEAEREILSRQADIEFVQAQIVEQTQELEEDRQELSIRESELRDEIKRVARSASPEEASAGMRVDLGDGWKISVSKVSTSLEYKSDDLLNDYPDLAEVEVDGDPLIRREVDPEILERLVASGQIDKDMVAPYTVVSVGRAAAVRISLGDDNE